MATTSCWFLVFVWVVWWLPLTLAGPEDEKGDGCSAKNCGNLTVSDPFWLPNWEAGRSCGPLDFEVGCINDSIPFLRSSGFDGHSGFSIMSISYEEHNLRVVDRHKKSDFNVPNACNFPRLNTSSKLPLPFKVNNSNLNLIFYNCTKAAGNPDWAMVELTCLDATNAYVRAGVRYDATGAYAGYALEGCDAIVVPVVSSAGSANASDYERLIRDGFLLTWDPLPPELPAPAGSVLKQIEVQRSIQIETKLHSMQANSGPEHHIEKEREAKGLGFSLDGI